MGKGLRGEAIPGVLCKLSVFDFSSLTLGLEALKKMMNSPRFCKFVVPCLTPVEARPLTCRDT